MYVTMPNSGAVTSSHPISSCTIHYFLLRNTFISKCSLYYMTFVSFSMNRLLFWHEVTLTYNIIMYTLPK